MRQYMTVAGEREVDLDTVTQYIPHGVGHAFLSPLQSNFNYSCVVESESSDVKQQTRPLLFSTPYSGLYQDIHALIYHAVSHTSSGDS